MIVSGSSFSLLYNSQMAWRNSTGLILIHD